MEKSEIKEIIETSYERLQKKRKQTKELQKKFIF